MMGGDSQHAFSECAELGPGDTRAVNSDHNTTRKEYYDHNGEKEWRNVRKEGNRRYSSCYLCRCRLDGFGCRQLPNRLVCELIHIVGDPYIK